MTPDCRSDSRAIKLSFLINVWKYALISRILCYISFAFHLTFLSFSLSPSLFLYLPLLRSLPCTFSEPMRVADIREGIARANREVSDKFNSFFKHKCVSVCVCVYMLRVCDACELYKLPSMLSSFVIPLKTAPNNTTNNKKNSLLAFDSLYDSNTIFSSNKTILIISNIIWINYI